MPGTAQRKRKNSKAAGPGKARTPKTRNNQATRVSAPPKPEGRGRPLNRNGTPQEISTTKTGDTRQDRREYERLRRQRPERQEANRKAEQKRRQKAKDLGLCQRCGQPAIPGQTRCETCAEAHRQSRRQSDANRRTVAKEAAATGQADQAARKGV